MAGPRADPARDVTILPFSSPGLLKIVRFGAATDRGQSLDLGPLMISSRLHKAIAQTVPPGQPVARLEADYVWAGVIFAHFGHFISETLPRLLSLRASLAAHPDRRILGFAAPGAGQTSPAALRPFFDLIDIDPALIDVIDQPTRVASLLIPPPPFLGRYRYAPGLLPLIDASPFSATEPSGERLFLSRAQLSGRFPRLPNIAEIEALYQDAGFTLYHPELHSIADQIARLTACAVLAGENGSALHWSLYSRHVTEVHSLGWSLALQRGICTVRGQTYRALRDPWLGRFKGRRQQVPSRVVRRALGLTGAHRPLMT